jgi:HAD superfamily hydrolase (TIGR01490 family)
VKDKRAAEEVVEENGKIAAFFDLDGTLVASPSLERRFFRMLRYRQEIRAKNYFLWLAEAVRVAPRGVSAILQANKMYLRGIAADRWRAGGLKPAPTFYEDGLERVAWHARQGHVIVMVSGTLEPLAVEAARALEEALATRGIATALRVCATRLEEVDGRWTGRILGEAMFGEAKARAARWIAAELKLDLAQCYGYGDSTSDRWLLAAVGRPVAVNPSRKLERIARMQGWRVLRWEQDKKVITQRRPDRAGAGAGRREIAETVFANCNRGPSAGKIVERVE